MITVASTSVVNGQNVPLDENGNVTLAKPSGLAVGDLMVAVIAATRSGSIDTKPGWTEIIDATYTSNFITKALWKYADAADVAANEFLFDTTSVTNPRTGGGVLYRITGAPSSDPKLLTATGLNSNQQTVSISCNLTPYIDEGLAIIVISQSDSVSHQVSGGYYVAGTGISNPTWTERFDLDNTSDDHTAAVADAPISFMNEITTFGWTAQNNSVSFQRGTIILIPAQTDVDGNSDYLAVDSTLFAQSGTNTLTLTNEYFAATPNFGSLSAIVKTSAAVTNQDKPAQSTVTNLPK